MHRATKIVATLGPASNTPEVLTRMIAAGVDVVRLNFSHGAASDHQERARIVREVAQRLGRTVAIMADLQGPKIRTGPLAGGGPVLLRTGQRFVITTARVLGDSTRVNTTFTPLPREVHRGDRIQIGRASCRERV